MLKKTIKILIYIILFSFVFQVNTAKAVLQNNENEPSSKERNTWVTEIRKMENLGGGLGLQETQNADLTSTESNNLDVHMQKNTEYGAMAILSASSYGKPDKIENGETTTGNKSGVYIPYNYEWTAAQYTSYYGGPNYNGWDNRYINYYGNPANYEKKRGDALLETNGWHETSSTYLSNENDITSINYSYGSNRAGGIVRNISQGIFAFNNHALYPKLHYVFSSWGIDRYDYYSETTTAAFNKLYTSRSVIVNGQGL